jgi:hypothetical protein
MKRTAAGPDVLDLRYDDRDGHRILREAVRLEHDHEQRAGGLTLADLKEIAREVGIHPDRVAEAASCVRFASSASTGTRFVGDTRWEVHGAARSTLDAAGMQEVIEGIRAAMGRHGRVVYTPCGIEWYWRERAGASFVSVTHTGGALVRVCILVERMDGAVMVLAAGAGVGAALAIPVCLALPFGGAAAIPVAAAMIATGFIGARALWAVAARKWAERLGHALRYVTGIAHMCGRAMPESEAG